MIDNQLLEAYIAELEALRGHGNDLARAYPDIASRLDIGSHRSRDPHVERIVESAAFLAARLRLTVAESATELPLAMLSLLAPALVEPVPSMAIVQMQAGSEPETIERGARFDYEVGGQALVCFSTTMEATVVPVSLRLRRLEPAGGFVDGIGIRINGSVTGQLMLYVGNDGVSGALLMDAIVEDLAAIELVPPSGGNPIPIPRASVRVHGLSAAEATLPERRASHTAHRVVTEFMMFPEKFRFVSLNEVPLPSGSEILLRFSKPLALPPVLAPNLITTNRVPVVNLWRLAATPFDITGRQLEYPVRVDALRYRTVECHSVEVVDIHGSSGARPQRIDPVLALGEISGSEIRWGVRRTVSRMGGEVLLYFQGLDYQQIGRQRYLAAPSVLASNRDMAQRIPVNAPLVPVDGVGDWTCSLASAPTGYRAALVGAEAMDRLIGYLRSSMVSLGVGVNLLREYLGRFPGAHEASWIDGLRTVTSHPVAVMRGAVPQPGLRIVINFEKERHRTTSLAMIKRVLAVLFESQRGINRVEDVLVRSS